jgi:transposase
MLTNYLILPLFLLNLTTSIINLSQNHIRHIIYHEYAHGTTTAQAARNINAMYGEDSITEHTCQNWYQRFRSGDNNFEDEPPSRRPSELDEQVLIYLVKEDNHQTTRDLAEQLGVDHATEVIHLRALGYGNKFGAWVPYNPSTKYKLIEANK